MARVGNIIVRDSDISRIKLELITFFKDNPGTIDCAERICINVGRPRDEVEGALEQLADHGICNRFATRPRALFMYSASAQILRDISDLAPEMAFDTKLELLDRLLARNKAR